MKLSYANAFTACWKHMQNEFTFEKHDVSLIFLIFDVGHNFLSNKGRSCSDIVGNSLFLYLL